MWIVVSTQRELEIPTHGIIYVMLLFIASSFFFTIFADRPNVLQDGTKTTKTCATVQTHWGLTLNRDETETKLDESQTTELFISKLLFY